MKNDGHIHPEHIPPVVIEEQPSHGSLVADQYGHFSYTPFTSFVGIDTFRYSLTEPSNEIRTGSATVTLHVTNHKPVAANKAYPTSQEHALSVSPTNGMLAGATDYEGNPLQVDVVLEPAHAESFDWDPTDGSFTYVPKDGYVGTDSFVFKIDEADSALLRYIASGSGTDIFVPGSPGYFMSIGPHSVYLDRPQYGIVTITVAPNTPPVANDESYTIPDGAPYLEVEASGVLENDTDADNAYGDIIDELTAARVTEQLGGSVALDPDGGFRFTPDASFDGHGHFKYVASDGMSESNEATVLISYGAWATVDLDIDSDNTQAVDRSSAEEAVEMEQPGQVLAYNNDDDNLNGIPDWEELGPFLDGDDNPMADDDLEIAYIDVINTYGENLAGYTVRFAVSNATVRIWDTPTKDNDFTDESWILGDEDPPTEVYIEGYQPGQGVISLVLQNPSGAETTRDKAIVTATRPSLTGFRPYGRLGDYGQFWKRLAVPEQDEMSAGVGIRRNGDFDKTLDTPDYDVKNTNVSENDLVEIEVSLPGTTPAGLEYILRRDSNNIRIWLEPTKNTLFLGEFLQETVGETDPDQNFAGWNRINFGSARKKSFWVEWVPRDGQSQTALVTAVPRTIAQDPERSKELPTLGDAVTFRPFNSIVIALGGEDFLNGVPLVNQQPSDPAPATAGTFDIARNLYAQGYDVWMYDEDKVKGIEAFGDTYGDGDAYEDVVNAIKYQGVTRVAIFGFSHGGGSTWALAHRLTRNTGTLPPAVTPEQPNNTALNEIGKPFTIAFTAYIDAIKDTTGITVVGEDRRPHQIAIPFKCVPRANPDCPRQK